MKKTQKKEPKKIDRLTIISGGILVFTLLVGSLFIYKPYIEKSKSLKQQIINEKNRNILLATIKAGTQHLDIYQKRLPKAKNISWLMSMVSDAAAQEQIEVSSIKPGIPEEMDLYTRLYVTLDTVSNYNKLGRFLAKIESSKQFMKVDELKIKRADEEENFKSETSRLKPYEVKASMVISTIALKE